jgi:hypothetical protein
MSAVVLPLGWSWFCATCCEGGGDFDTEEAADGAAARHDEDNEHGKALDRQLGAREETDT